MASNGLTPEENRLIVELIDASGRASGREDSLQSGFRTTITRSLFSLDTAPVMGDSTQDIDLGPPVTVIALSLDPTYHRADTATTDEEKIVTEETLVLGTTTVVSTALSVGYVIWLVRGGSLLMTMVASLPSWSSFDPLPIVDSFEHAQKKQEEDQESLHSLVG